MLMAETEPDLQKLLDVVNSESEIKGLTLNIKKTEVMVISKNKNNPICNITLKGNILKQVDKFKYLGTIITSDGKCIHEIKNIIFLAKTAFQKMKSILTNKKLSLNVRKRILQCYNEPILLYGCETWTISKQTHNLLEDVEMWFLRRMMRISWTAKKTNESVLNEANETRRLITAIRKRQAKFIGHVMRQKQLENLVTTGKLNGTRSRGRPREKLLDGLSIWMRSQKPSALLSITPDREEWRTMIANASRQGT